MEERSRPWSVRLPQCPDRLATGKPGVHLVPVADGRLPQLPAEADVAALVPAGEVDQAHPIVLQLAADLGQLVDEILEVLEVRLEPALDFLLGGAGREMLQVGLGL